eukprot:g5392.t1
MSKLPSSEPFQKSRLPYEEGVINSAVPLARPTAARSAYYPVRRLFQLEEEPPMEEKTPTADDAAPIAEAEAEPEKHDEEAALEAAAPANDETAVADVAAAEMEMHEEAAEPEPAAAAAVVEPVVEALADGRMDERVATEEAVAAAEEVSVNVEETAPGDDAEEAPLKDFEARWLELLTDYDALPIFTDEILGTEAAKETVVAAKVETADIQKTPDAETAKTAVEATTRPAATQAEGCPPRSKKRPFPRTIRSCGATRCVTRWKRDHPRAAATAQEKKMQPSIAVCRRIAKRAREKTVKEEPAGAPAHEPAEKDEQTARKPAEKTTPNPGDQARNRAPRRIRKGKLRKSAATQKPTPAKESSWIKRMRCEKEGPKAAAPTKRTRRRVRPARRPRRINEHPVKDPCSNEVDEETYWDEVAVWAAVAVALISQKLCSTAHGCVEWTWRWRDATRPLQTEHELLQASTRGTSSVRPRSLLIEPSSYTKEISALVFDDYRSAPESAAANTPPEQDAEFTDGTAEAEASSTKPMAQPTAVPRKEAEPAVMRVKTVPHEKPTHCGLTALKWLMNEGADCRNPASADHAKTVPGHGSDGARLEDTIRSAIPEAAVQKRILQSGAITLSQFSAILQHAGICAQAVRIHRWLPEKGSAEVLKRMLLQPKLIGTGRGSPTAAVVYGDGHIEVLQAKDVLVQMPAASGARTEAREEAESGALRGKTKQKTKIPLPRLKLFLAELIDVQEPSRIVSAEATSVEAVKSGTEPEAKKVMFSYPDGFEAYGNEESSSEGDASPPAAASYSPTAKSSNPVNTSAASATSGALTAAAPHPDGTQYRGNEESDSDCVMISPPDTAASPVAVVDNALVAATNPDRLLIHGSSDSDSDCVMLPPPTAEPDAAAADGSMKKGTRAVADETSSEPQMDEDAFRQKAAPNDADVRATVGATAAAGAATTSMARQEGVHDAESPRRIHQRGVAGCAAIAVCKGLQITRSKSTSLARAVEAELGFPKGDIRCFSPSPSDADRRLGFRLAIQAKAFETEYNHGTIQMPPAPPLLFRIAVYEKQSTRKRPETRDKAEKDGGPALKKRRSRDESSSSSSSSQSAAPVQKNKDGSSAAEISSSQRRSPLQHVSRGQRADDNREEGSPPSAQRSPLFTPSRERETEQPVLGGVVDFDYSSEEEELMPRGKTTGTSELASKEDVASARHTGRAEQERVAPPASSLLSGYSSDEELLRGKWSSDEDEDEQDERSYSGMDLVSELDFMLQPQLEERDDLWRHEVREEHEEHVVEKDEHGEHKDDSLPDAAQKNQVKPTASIDVWCLPNGKEDKALTKMSAQVNKAENSFQSNRLVSKKKCLGEVCSVAVFVIIWSPTEEERLPAGSKTSAPERTKRLAEKAQAAGLRQLLKMPLTKVASAYECGNFTGKRRPTFWGEDSLRRIKAARITRPAGASATDVHLRVFLGRDAAADEAAAQIRTAVEKVFGTTQAQVEFKAAFKTWKEREMWRSMFPASIALREMPAILSVQKEPNKLTERLSSSEPVEGLTAASSAALTYLRWVQGQQLLDSRLERKDLAIVKADASVQNPGPETRMRSLAAELNLIYLDKAEVQNRGIRRFSPINFHLSDGTQFALAMKQEEVEAIQRRAAVFKEHRADVLREQHRRTAASHQKNKSSAATDGTQQAPPPQKQREKTKSKLLSAQVTVKIFGDPDVPEVLLTALQQGKQRGTVSPAEEVVPAEIHPRGAILPDIAEQCRDWKTWAGSALAQAVKDTKITKRKCATTSVSGARYKDVLQPALSAALRQCSEWEAEEIVTAMKKERLITVATSSLLNAVRASINPVIVVVRYDAAHEEEGKKVTSLLVSHWDIDCRSVRRVVDRLEGWHERTAQNPRGFPPEKGKEARFTVAGVSLGNIPTEVEPLLQDTSFRVVVPANATTSSAYERSKIALVVPAEAAEIRQKRKETRAEQAKKALEAARSVPREAKVKRKNDNPESGAAKRNKKENELLHEEQTDELLWGKGKEEVKKENVKSAKSTTAAAKRHTAAAASKKKGAEPTVPSTTSTRPEASSEVVGCPVLGASATASNAAAQSTNRAQPYDRPTKAGETQPAARRTDAPKVQPNRADAKQPDPDDAEILQAAGDGLANLGLGDIDQYFQYDRATFCVNFNMNGFNANKAKLYSLRSSLQERAVEARARTWSALLLVSETKWVHLLKSEETWDAPDEDATPTNLAATDNRHHAGKQQVHPNDAAGTRRLELLRPLLEGLEPFPLNEVPTYQGRTTPDFMAYGGECERSAVDILLACWTKDIAEPKVEPVGSAAWCGHFQDHAAIFARIPVSEEEWAKEEEKDWKAGDWWKKLWRPEVKNLKQLREEPQWELVRAAVLPCEKPEVVYGRFTEVALLPRNYLPDDDIAVATERWKYSVAENPIKTRRQEPLTREQAGEVMKRAEKKRKQQKKATNMTRFWQKQFSS